LLGEKKIGGLRHKAATGGGEVVREKDRIVHEDPKVEKAGFVVAGKTSGKKGSSKKKRK